MPQMVTPWPGNFADKYRQAGYWTDLTLGALPAQWAENFPDHLAMVAGNDRRTYAELHDRALGAAAGFESLGVGRDDRVIVQLPNIAEFFEVLFGLSMLGAIPVVVLPAYRRSELAYFCEFTEAVAYVIADRHAGFDFRSLASDVRRDVPSLRHVVVAGDSGEFISLSELRSTVPQGWVPTAMPDPGGAAIMHLSGGTTGVPKLIARTHHDYLYGARASAEVCRLTQKTVYLCSLPVGHQFSLSAPGALGTFSAGGTVVLAPNPAPDTVFPLIELERVTIAALVPPLVKAWLDTLPNQKADLTSLELLQVGGAKLSYEMASRIGPELGCQLQQVFGMTEGLLNFTRLDDPEEIVLSTQGRPLSPDDEVRVVDDDDRIVPAGEPGHLLARGPYTIRGYYRAEAHNAVSFTEDGFYRTGDIVRQLPTGHLVVVGRAKDQINRGGEKIAAEEIENHLLAHPGVTEAAVVAMPDPFLGERTCAFVVPSQSVPSEAELMGFVRGRGVATHKVPDRIEFVDALPRTAVGKVSKQSLREHAATTIAGGAKI